LLGNRTIAEDLGSNPNPQAPTLQLRNLYTPLFNSTLLFIPQTSLQYRLDVNVPCSCFYENGVCQPLATDNRLISIWFQDFSNSNHLKKMQVTPPRDSDNTKLMFDMALALGFNNRCIIKICWLGWGHSISKIRRICLKVVVVLCRKNLLVSKCDRERCRIIDLYEIFWQNFKRWTSEFCVLQQKYLKWVMFSAEFSYYVKKTFIMILNLRIYALGSVLGLSQRRLSL